MKRRIVLNDTIYRAKDIVRVTRVLVDEVNGGYNLKLRLKNGDMSVIELDETGENWEKLVLFFGVERVSNFQPQDRKRILPINK